MCNTPEFRILGIRRIADPLDYAAYWFLVKYPTGHATFHHIARTGVARAFSALALESKTSREGGRRRNPLLPQMILNVRLENRQSVARDHLANERTFLAWVRTSLTFASAGIALTQLFRLSELKESHFAYRVSTIIGSLFVSASILCLLLGAYRYFHVQTVLQDGIFPASRLEVGLSFVVSMSLVVVALALILKAAAP